MWNIFTKFASVFFEKKFTAGETVILFVVSLLIALFINNLFGFTFYYELKQKTVLIKEFEVLKKQIPDDERLVEFVNEAELRVIKRKNIADSFLELFRQEEYKPESSDSVLRVFSTGDVKPKLALDTVRKANNINSVSDFEGNREDSVYYYEYQFGVNFDSIISNYSSTENVRSIANPAKKTKKYRSRLWHTVTSGVLIIIITVFSIISILFIPLHAKKDERLGAFVAILLFVPFLAFGIWFCQWILGFIPVINNMPWINYVINLSVNILIVLMISVRFSKKKKHKSNNS